MADDSDEEDKKPKLKLVTESSGGGDDGSGSGSNVVSLGYFGDESEDESESESNNDFDKDDDVLAKAASSITHELLREDIMAIMAHLSPRQRSVLELRFGLKDGKTRTLEEVGKIFGLTRERIRQIEANALRGLRHPNRSRRQYPVTTNQLTPKPFAWSLIREKLSHFKSLDRRILKMLWEDYGTISVPIAEVAERFNVSYEYVIELNKQARKLFDS